MPYYPKIRESIIDAREIAAAADDKRILELYQFWEDARGPNRFPSQADLDLIRIPKLLPNVFIIDLISDDNYYYRYMGSALDDYYGAALTGKTLRDYRGGRFMEILLTFMFRIARAGELGILTTQLTSEAQDWAEYTRVGLPIADDHETPNKVVGLVLVRQSEETIEHLSGVLALRRDERGRVDAMYGTL